MEIKKIVEKLKSSDEFGAWRASHPDAYLTHVFTMIEKDAVPVWQVGFFDVSEGLVYSFEIGSEVKLNPPEPPFGPEGTVVEELNIDSIDTGFNDALDKASEIQNSKYSMHKPMKKIVILQVLQGIGTVYNITYVTQTFKTLNIKVDACNGNVIEDKLVEIFRFDK